MAPYGMLRTKMALRQLGIQNLFMVFENDSTNKFVRRMLLRLTLDYWTHKFTYQECHLAVCPGWLMVQSPRESRAV